MASVRSQSSYVEYYDQQYNNPQTDDYHKSFTIIDKYLNSTNVVINEFGDQFAKSKSAVLSMYDDYIAHAKQQEQVLCNMLHASSIKEIEERIRTLQNTTNISALSGPEMKQVWQADFLNKAKLEGLQKLQDKWLGYVDKELSNSDIYQNLITSEEWQQFFYGLIGAKNAAGRSIQRGRFKSPTGINFDVKTGSKTIDITKLSDTQRVRLAEFLDKTEIGKKATAKEAAARKISGFEMDMEQNGSSIETWMTINSKTVAPLTPEELQARNRRLKQYILDKVGMQKYKHKLEQAINIVLAGKATALTENVTQNMLEGILGEIQAVFYFLVLYNSSEQNYIPDWIGGTTATGSKPHADIVLRDLVGTGSSRHTGNKAVGIQIKNTDKDILKVGSKTITFRTLKAASFFQEYSNDISKYLDYGQGIDAFMKAAEDMYQMYLFHVEYERIPDAPEEGPWFRRGTSHDPFFPSIRASIDALWKKTSFYLEMLAASLMYLDTAASSLEDFNKNPTTTMFIIGGISCIGIVQVLQELRAEIEANSYKNTQFSLTPHFVDTDNHFTIVDYRNNGDTLNGNRTNAQQVQNIMDRIKLQSSYTFINIGK